jgi:hypothetical protein
LGDVPLVKGTRSSIALLHGQVKSFWASCGRAAKMTKIPRVVGESDNGRHASQGRGHWRKGTNEERFQCLPLKSVPLLPVLLAGFLISSSFHIMSILETGFSAKRLPEF